MSWGGRRYIHCCHSSGVWLLGSRAPLWDAACASQFTCATATACWLPAAQRQRALAAVFPPVLDALKAPPLLCVRAVAAHKHMIDSAAVP